MRIGELADSTGVSTRSLRYFEEQGLIRSSRTAGGWREFDQSMVERVVMIQHLLAPAWAVRPSASSSLPPEPERALAHVSLNGSTRTAKLTTSAPLRNLIAA
jgi:hypothetical protein